MAFGRENETTSGVADPTTQPRRGDNRTQDNVANTAQVLHAMQENSTQMMATLQENTKVLNQLLLMFAQLIPSTSATVAAQQGLAPLSPVIAALQHTSQELQSSNPPVGNEGVIPRVEEPALVTVPVVNPPPRHNHEVGDAGIQPGGSSSSHAALQHVIHGTTTTAPVEAATSTPRGSFVTKDDLDVYLKEIQQKSSAGVLDLKLPYNQRIAVKPYPKDYVSPKFMLFNGKRKCQRAFAEIYRDAGGLWVG